MLGNGVVGILSESTNKWERRVPLTPSHCARLLHGKTGVARIIVQPSTKRIHHDALYEDVGCEISEDLSECGFILGIKQPKLELEMILPDRAYAFFSHTHKAQRENMPLLDKVLAERATLFDYELITGDHGKRLLAFGKFAGLAGTIDFLCGLGQRYLNLGYSAPFLSVGKSYMYSSLASAKAAVISVGEEIATMGLPATICPLVIVFTGAGNVSKGGASPFDIPSQWVTAAIGAQPSVAVSQGAREIFRLLPHTFVEPSKLPELFEKVISLNSQGCNSSRENFKKSVSSIWLCFFKKKKVYGCVVTCQDMVEHKDPSESFDKADYYAHPNNYRPVFHERIAPYTSVLDELQGLVKKRSPLVGISDITCDIGFPILWRYSMPVYWNLSFFKMSRYITCTLKRACIVHTGALTSLYEYIPRMRNSDLE
ncbi:hypothetical protein BUALT_Bualt09G0047200 [Buddleja alternifolia]|uniref:Alanine dehydrogenase/pyridine nucleotide transhydrogenase N-terminal domain-containing protein n=1 Tax=Buddleja alternifolia TaxID=168488 RepID=A0AAV6X1Q5_9LAMI|nr:hypothetical protein BUALT_Bualt09G0047200 [Buddleja alternifolia]